MPGFLLHEGATVKCVHGGKADPSAPIPKVTVGGQAIVTQASSYVITGCPFNVSSSPVPCVTAQWVVPATRITSFGVPVLLIDSQATCAPNCTPLIISATQTKVVGI